MTHELTEQAFSEMVSGALSAHKIETELRRVLERTNNQNGNRSSIISLPGGQGVRLNVPSAQELGVVLLGAAVVSLQTARITLVALNDLDTRLRSMRPPRHLCKCGYEHQNDPRLNIDAGDNQVEDRDGKPKP